MSGSSRPGRTGPHDGLRDPAAPGAGCSPRTRSTRRWSRPPVYVPVVLSADDYIELLPARWQAIGAAGHPDQVPHL